MFKTKEPEMKDFKFYEQNSIIFLCSIFLFILCSGFFRAQVHVSNTEVYSSFCSVYIDNSRLNPKDGLTSAMVDRFKQINDSLGKADSLKYILFLSNSVNGEPVNTYTSTSAVINKIYGGVTDFPSIAFDYEKFKKSIFKKPFTISEKIEMHYFLTDEFCKSIQGKPKKIITELAQKIILLTNFNKEVNIYLYYSNQTGLFREKELTDEFNIYNQPRFKSNIKIHVIQI